jgi:DNA adenine methylase
MRHLSLCDMSSAPQLHLLKEAIEELKREFLDSIPPPPRPMAPFRWAGGKGNLVKWLIQYIPNGHTYVEPFAGAASVFWHLPTPFPVEVLNDLDGDIVNLYRVLQDKAKFEELAHRLIFTPYARVEFVRAPQTLKDPNANDIDRAWAFFVKQNQGFGGMAETQGNWGRAITLVHNNMAATTSQWRSRLKLLSFWHERLSSVQIDCTDGIACIQYWDAPDTVFYVDPPYTPSTRKDRRIYRNELGLAYHERLVAAILAVKGKVMLSCYDHPVYAPLTKAGWLRLTKETACHMAAKIRGSKLQGAGSAKAHVPRTETLYLNFTPPGFGADLFGTG